MHFVADSGRDRVGSPNGYDYEAAVDEYVRALAQLPRERWALLHPREVTTLDALSRRFVKRMKRHNRSGELLSVAFGHGRRRLFEQAWVRAYEGVPDLRDDIQSGARFDAADAARAVVCRDLITEKEFRRLTRRMRRIGVDFDGVAHHEAGAE